MKPAPTKGGGRRISAPIPALPFAIPPSLLQGDEPVRPPRSGPGQKFALGSEAAAAPASLEPVELPPAYGTGVLSLTARDPRCLYAYWDLTLEQQSHFNALAAGKHLTIRVRRTGPGQVSSVEVDVHPESRHWFVHVPDAGTQYVAELGYYRPGGEWTGIITAAPVTTPPDSVADDKTVVFATLPPPPPAALVAPVPNAPPPPTVQPGPVDPPESATRAAPVPASTGTALPLNPPGQRSQPAANGKGAIAERPAPMVPPDPVLPQPPQGPWATPPPHSGPVPPACPPAGPNVGPAASPATVPVSPPGPLAQGSPGSSALPAGVPSADITWTPALEGALAELIQLLHHGQNGHRAPSSAELAEWLRRLRPGGAASLELAQPPAPAVPAPTGPSSPGPEGPPAAAPPGQRSFWFNLNAELILYGATEPTARVTVCGRPIRLRPDGTFSYRFALPDGSYELSMMATSADGESRYADLKFSRLSEYSGEVGVHPQDPALQPPTGANLA